MPPKKKPPEASKKTEQKKREKVVEDKTFGLKNKKGAKTQKFIQQVNKSHGPPKLKTDEVKKPTKKEEKAKELNELNQIFRPVAVQKVEKGVDPKSVLCAFFKQGQCTKGDKCKFSHDTAVERKGEKRSIYCDARDSENNEEKMDDWDDDKLKDVVEKKHSEAERNRTSIICKFFIDALETRKYGWFWTCPNGGDKCQYRHALPPGFVLKRDKKKEEKKDEISIEDLVEKERAKLGVNLAKITLQTFLEWKKQKLSEKRAKYVKEEERKKQEFKAGRHIGLSGRDMFTFNPDLADDGEMDEGESALGNFEREEDESERDVKFREIKLESLQAEAEDIDAEALGKITQRTSKPTVSAEKTDEEEEDDDDANDENACGDEEAMPIDEDLFDDDELDNIEEELNELTVQ